MRITSKINTNKDELFACSIKTLKSFFADQMISIMMGAEGFPLFALGVVAVTVMLLAGYYALTTAACVSQVAAPRA